MKNREKERESVCCEGKQFEKKRDEIFQMNNQSCEFLSNHPSVNYNNNITTVRPFIGETTTTTAVTISNNNNITNNNTSNNNETKFIRLHTLPPLEIPKALNHLNIPSVCVTRKLIWYNQKVCC
ncbi:unnamed protein product [Trichobilharzia regenti]|nr:unnamed protein product [Trichobilharzia regenti]